MRQHNPTAEGKSVGIDVTENGYILSFEQCYSRHKRVFETFDDLISFVGYLFHLKGITD